jgi:hypothetical protein
MAARRGRWQRDLAKERHWRRIVREWRRSELSVRDFCDWQALSEACFYAWRRELAKRDREAAAAAAESTAARGGRPVKQNGPSRIPAAAFLPVRVVSDGVAEDTTSSRRPDAIEVHLPGGVRLLVPPGCDRTLLRDVLACCARTEPESPPC